MEPFAAEKGKSNKGIQRWQEMSVDPVRKWGTSGSVPVQYVKSWRNNFV